MSGSVSQVGTRIFISGTASGIDTAALIDAAVNQKLVPAERLQVQIDENSTKIGAYQELETVGANLQTALDNLIGNPGLFDNNETAFDQRSGTVITSDGSDFSGILDIGIDSEAVKGTYTIEVTQTAQAQKVIGSIYADQDADLGLAGSFDIGLSGGGATANISIAATDSLAEIAARINAESDTTNVQASVLKVGENQFQLVLTGQETNKTIDITNIAGDNVLNATGVIDGGGAFTNELQAARGAIVEFDGVTITRDDNTIDDLAPGITLDLRNQAPGTIINLEVDNDNVAVKEAIIAFVDSYNALKDFVNKNQQVSSDGVVSDDSILFGDNILDGLNTALSNAIGENIDGTGNIQTLRDLGLTFDGNNKLVIDDVALDDAILNDFDEIQSAFGASATTANPELQLLSSNSIQGSIDISFGIKTNGAGTITRVDTDLGSGFFEINGNSFTGLAGTPYDGLTFSYQGTALSVSVNFSFSQGIADRLNNILDAYTDPVDGLIIQEKAALQEQNTDKSAEAQEIITAAEAFREREIERYANFEAELQALNNLLNQIRAILGTDDDDN